MGVQSGGDGMGMGVQSGELRASHVMPRKDRAICMWESGTNYIIFMKSRIRYVNCTTYNTINVIVRTVMYILTATVKRSVEQESLCALNPSDACMLNVNA